MCQDLRGRPEGGEILAGRARKNPPKIRSPAKLRCDRIIPAGRKTATGSTFGEEVSMANKDKAKGKDKPKKGKKGKKA
jgi:hypothetical protein